VNPNLLQETGIACLRATRSVWRQSVPAEPLELAFARLFGRVMGAPMLTVAVPFGGRIVTVHLHAGGIATVYDPASGGWEIRTLRPEARREEVGNVAASSSGDHVVPVSLVAGERIGTGRDVTANLHQWIRR